MDENKNEMTVRKKFNPELTIADFFGISSDKEMNDGVLVKLQLTFPIPQSTTDIKIMSSRRSFHLNKNPDFFLSELSKFSRPDAKPFTMVKSCQGDCFDIMVILRNREKANKPFIVFLDQKFSAVVKANYKFNTSKAFEQKFKQSTTLRKQLKAGLSDTHIGDIYYITEKEITYICASLILTLVKSLNKILIAIVSLCQSPKLRGCLLFCLTYTSVVASLFPIPLTRNPLENNISFFNSLSLVFIVLFLIFKSALS
jgi:hypothetical protein